MTGSCYVEPDRLRGRNPRSWRSSTA